MLFNSLEFIFFFLPIVTLGYWFVQRFGNRAGTFWLVGSSLVFYSWWNLAYLPLILGSAVFNFHVARTIGRLGTASPFAKPLLAAGIAANLLLLGYFKYTDFLLENFNWATGMDVPLQNIVLPLAISFFTFQQISFLVDSYKGLAKESSFSTYLLFITFFPQLIAGPIVHHREMMPQFMQTANQRINYGNLASGLFIFCIGLFKKVIIADEFALTANAGFGDAAQLTFLEGWATSLSYTFQLYFDFSAYCDMAIGAALFFNIRLPDNFNSPYKARDIQDFWRRWHITLSRFLRDYVYIPLGGNRKGLPSTLCNLLVTFILGGIWHGAAWTFVIWGALHGFALIVHRLWLTLGIRLNGFIAWFVTFNFINLSWVFFRAESVADANHVLKAMLGLNGIVVPTATMERWPALAEFAEARAVMPVVTHLSQTEWLMIAVFLAVVVWHKNSIEMMKALRFDLPALGLALAASVWATISINRISEFLYFNF